jgi:hypothetical protein
VGRREGTARLSVVTDVVFRFCVMLALGWVNKERHLSVLYKPHSKITPNRAPFWQKTADRSISRFIRRRTKGPHGRLVLFQKVAVPPSVNNTPKLDKFVAFNSTVKNVNANNRCVGIEYWTLREASGAMYYPVPISYNVNRFGPATTNPGDVVNGIVTVMSRKTRNLRR